MGLGEKLTLCYLFLKDFKKFRLFFFSNFLKVIFRKFIHLVNRTYYYLTITNFKDFQRLMAKVMSIGLKKKITKKKQKNNTNYIIKA